MDELKIKNGQRIGYRRVSTLEQSEERQLDGIEVDKTFTDYASGGTTNRPALKDLMDYIREGDTLVVHSIDRLARNLSDLKKLVDHFTDQHIAIHFIKENLKFGDNESTILDNLLLNILGSFAEFERQLLLERQREGIKKARESGAYQGKMPSLTKKEAEEAVAMVKNGIPLARVAREYNISRSSMYRYMNGERTAYRPEGYERKLTRKQKRKQEREYWINGKKTKISR